MKESLGAFYGVGVIALTWYSVQAGVSFISGMIDKRKAAYRIQVEDALIKKIHRAIDDDRRWRV